MMEVESKPLLLCTEHYDDLQVTGEGLNPQYF